MNYKASCSCGKIINFGNVSQQGVIFRQCKECGIYFCLCASGSKKIIIVFIKRGEDLREEEEKVSSLYHQWSQYLKSLAEEGNLHRKKVLQKQIRITEQKIKRLFG